MSTLRNTIQRRNHRERAQPRERQKWGLLEKPKDYKLRAADHRVKKRKLKTLQQKADERNEDEFYFAMVNSESRGGVKVAKRRSKNEEGRVLKDDVVKLMKTQDVGYLRTMLQRTMREKEKIEEAVVGSEVGVNMDLSDSNSRRVVFDENREAEPSSKQDSGDLATDDEESEEDDQKDPKNRALNKMRKKLQGLKDQERDLSAALKEVEEQRARMNGSVGGVNKNGIKFKARQRRR